MKLTLQELLKVSREHGVTEMSADTENAGVVKFTLGPLIVPEKDQLEGLDEEERKQFEPEEPVKGKDGLTAEQQELLYGRPMSDTKK